MNEIHNLMAEKNIDRIELQFRLGASVRVQLISNAPRSCVERELLFAPQATVDTIYDEVKDALRSM